MNDTPQRVVAIENRQFAALIEISDRVLVFFASQGLEITIQSLQISLQALIVEITLVIGTTTSSLSECIYMHTSTPLSGEAMVNRKKTAT